MKKKTHKTYTIIINYLLKAFSFFGPIVGHGTTHGPSCATDCPRHCCPNSSLGSHALPSDSCSYLLLVLLNGCPGRICQMQIVNREPVQVSIRRCHLFARSDGAIRGVWCIGWTSFTTSFLGYGATAEVGEEANVFWFGVFVV